MSAVFPEILPEELLYSALARYGDMMRFPGQKAVLDAAFGRRTGIAAVELPGPIDALIERLPGGHRLTADGLVDAHTTLPYYARFIAPDRIAGAAATLRVRGSGGLAESLGIRPSAVPIATHLRYCPRCSEEDRATHGVAYWRRAHQLPGVVVCPDHGAALWATKASRRPAVGRHVFRSLEGTLEEGGVPIQDGAGHPRLFARIARDSLWLLTNGRVPVTAAALHARYVRRLSEHGWMRSAKHIRIGELREAFVAHHGARALATLGCGLDTHTGEDDWLARLVRKPRAAQHPLHHLLVVEFLGCTLVDFFAEPARPAPREAPSHVTVPCPDAVCPTAATGGGGMRPAPGNALRCVPCGCTFRQAKTAGARPVVLLYGFLWDARLRRLILDAGMTLRGIARALGVTPKTVQRHAARLRVWRAEWNARPSSPSRRRLAASEARTAQRRAEWLGLRAEHPEEGVQALRARAPATYAHLYRCDRRWLDEHHPPRAPTRPRAPRVDWDLRDRAMCEIVEAVIAGIRAAPGRPVRLTRGYVASHAGHSTLLWQHLDRLPRTAACIALAEESREAHARRKLRWAEAQFRAEGKLPTAWEVVRRAALRADLAVMLAREVEAVVHHLENPSSARAA